MLDAILKMTPEQLDITITSSFDSIRKTICIPMQLSIYGCNVCNWRSILYGWVMLLIKVWRKCANTGCR